MKAATIYIADDNTRFDDEEKCKNYEAECIAVKSALLVLGDKVDNDGCDFSNGSGYIQHHQSAVAHARMALLKIAQTLTDHIWIEQSIADPLTHESYAGRIISDLGHTALNRAWYRIACTDKQSREWGQPYYANHPYEATDKCLSDRSGMPVETL